jgi:hypothetical protein
MGVNEGSTGTGVTGGEGSTGSEGAAQISVEQAGVADILSDMIDQVSSSPPKNDQEKEREDGVDQDQERAKRASKQDKKEEAGESKEEGKEDKTEDDKVDKGEGEKKTDEEDKDEVIRQLREQLANKESSAEKIDDTTKEEKIVIPDFTGDFFENDAEYDKAFEDKATMNNVLKKVYTRGVEATLKVMPKVIEGLVQSQFVMYNAANGFFQRNPELKGYTEFVTKVANEITSKEPALKLNEVFGDEQNPGKLATEVKKRLALKDKAIKKEEKKEQQRPAFVKGGGARVKEEQPIELNGVEKEIAELII